MKLQQSFPLVRLGTFFFSFPFASFLNELINVAKNLSANEIDQLESPIVIEKKREFVSLLFVFLEISFLISICIRKPTAKARYMQKEASVDVISVSDDSIQSVR